MIHKSSIVIERIDYLLMEKGASVFPKADFMAMIADSLECHIEQVWRVKLLDDDTFNLCSFALPQPEKNLNIGRCLNQVDMPDWIKERISVLQICDTGETVEGVGQKVSENVFYVIE